MGRDVAMRLRNKLSTVMKASSSSGVERLDTPPPLAPPCGAELRVAAKLRGLERLLECKW